MKWGQEHIRELARKLPLTYAKGRNIPSPFQKELNCKIKIIIYVNNNIKQNNACILQMDRLTNFYPILRTSDHKHKILGQSLRTDIPVLVQCAKLQQYPCQLISEPLTHVNLFFCKCVCSYAFITNLAVLSSFSPKQSFASFSSVKLFCEDEIQSWAEALHSTSVASEVKHKIFINFNSAGYLKIYHFSGFAFR